MNLTDDQKAAVKQWAEEGATLNDIQKRLKDELGVSMTYLETRFLVSDLGLTTRDPKQEEREKQRAREQNADADGIAEAELVGDNGEPADQASGSGGVSVTVDSIAIPGTAYSGKVTFSDGKKAAWYVDQFGSLGLDADEPGYRPSQADAIGFQRQLQKALRGM